MPPISSQPLAFYPSINSSYPRFSGQDQELSPAKEEANPQRFIETKTEFVKVTESSKKGLAIASQFIKSGVLEERAFPNLSITNADFLKAFYQKTAFKHASPIEKLQQKIFNKKLSASAGQELPLNQLASIAHKANTKYSKVHPLLQKIAPAIQVNTMPAITSTEPLTAHFSNDLEKALEESSQKNEIPHYRSQRILSLPSYIKALHNDPDKTSLMMTVIHSHENKKPHLESIHNYLQEIIKTANNKNAESLLYVAEDSIGLTAAGKILAEQLL